jgi:hypothetical protein
VSRGFADILLEVLVMVAGCAVALVLLAVFLIRGRRVAQVLTCLLCAVIGIAELAQDQSDSGLAGDGSHSSVPVVIALVCLAVIVLLVLPPTARRFFARDAGRPFGVLSAAVIGLYLGYCALVAGALLMLAGGVGTKYVWWGIGFFVVGCAMVAVGVPLRAGVRRAREVAALCYVAYLVLGFVVTHAAGNTVTAGSLIPCGLVLAAIAGLYVVPSSTAHFGADRPVSVRPGALAVSSAVVIAVVGVACAGFGFRSSAVNASFASGLAVSPSPDPSPTLSQPTDSAAPTFAPPTDTPVPSAAPTDVTSDTPPPSVPTVAAGPLTHRWTLTESANGGYQLHVEFDVGTPQKLVEGLTNGSVTAGTACNDISSQTDAVIPAEVIVTNTSPGGFSVDGAYQLSADYQNAEAELNYSDSGPSCRGGTIGTQWNSGLASGAAGQSFMFFVLHNYYSPNFPNGDPQVLAAATVSFENASSDKAQFTAGSPIGPDTSDGQIPLGG